MSISTLLFLDCFLDLYKWQYLNIVSKDLGTPIHHYPKNWTFNKQRKKRGFGWWPSFPFDDLNFTLLGAVKYVTKSPFLIRDNYISLILIFNWNYLASNILDTACVLNPIYSLLKSIASLAIIWNKVVDWNELFIPFIIVVMGNIWCLGGIVTVPENTLEIIGN